MSELDDIRAIVAVIDNGGFAKAAKSLGIAKSIVSRRIARLEASLGTRLLNRSTHGMNATEAGLEYKAYGERILNQVAEAHDAVVKRRGAIVGRLRLALPHSLGIRYITPVLAKLAKDNPGLEVDVVYSDRQVDLLNESFDAAVGLDALRDSALVSRRIGLIRGVVVASPDYLSRCGTPLVPADLVKHNCLVNTRQGNASPWVFGVGRRQISIMPKSRFHANDAEGLLQAAEAGVGIASAPRFMATDGIEAGRLVPVLTDFPILERGFYIVRPPGSYVPAKVRALTDVLVESFSGKPDWDLRRHYPNGTVR